MRKKIISLIKSKIKLNTKEIDTKEAEKIISEFNKQNIVNKQSPKTRLLLKTSQNKKN